MSIAKPDKTLILHDNADDHVEFTVVSGELYVSVNGGTEVILEEGAVAAILRHLNGHFARCAEAPKAEVPKALEKVGEVMIDSRDLPANIVLNVTGNVTINN